MALNFGLLPDNLDDCCGPFIIDLDRFDPSRSIIEENAGDRLREEDFLDKIDDDDGVNVDDWIENFASIKSFDMIAAIALFENDFVVAN